MESVWRLRAPRGYSKISKRIPKPNVRSNTTSSDHGTHRNKSMKHPAVPSHPMTSRLVQWFVTRRVVSFNTLEPIEVGPTLWQFLSNDDWLLELVQHMQKKPGVQPENIPGTRGCTPKYRLTDHLLTPKDHASTMLNIGKSTPDQARFWTQDS